MRRNRTVNAEDFLPKCVAWWFALSGKAGVRNIEEIVWAKFPRLCPYCKSPEHIPEDCKDGSKNSDVIDWEYLRSVGNETQRPKTLGEWQEMFNDIYPRKKGDEDQTDSIRLSEELGELCEAIRSLVVAPRYFLSEAPDVFAWLMGIANQFDVDNGRPVGYQLERLMGLQYSDRCRLCDFSICKCPPIHPDTLGRIAEEATTYIDITGPAFGLQQNLHWFQESLTELSAVRASRRG